jgi:PAS domain S-box-containing protein
MSADDAASKITGGTIEQLLAQNFGQLESWRRSGMLDAAENALMTMQVHVLETRVVTTFGKNLWYDCCFAPFYHEDELHLLVLVSDITERKRAEDAVKASHAELQALAGRL